MARETARKQRSSLSIFTKAPARKISTAAVARAAQKVPRPNNQAARSAHSRYQFTLFSNDEVAENGSASNPTSSTTTRRSSSGPEEHSDAEDERPTSEPPGSDRSDLGLDNDTPKATRNLKHVIKVMRIDVRSKTSSTELEPWNLAARYLGRALTMFLRSSLAFNVGLDIDLDDDDESDGDPSASSARARLQLEPNQVEELRLQSKFIIGTMPNLQGDIDVLLERPDALAVYARYIDHRVRAARSDDQGSLNKHYLKFIKALPENKTEHVPHHLEKRDRGFYNTFTARLLCPQDQLTEFDADPEEFCTLVRNGEKSFTADDFPSLLYDPQLVQQDDALAGFLRGSFLIKCFKCLFTGPATALGDKQLNDKGPGRPPIAISYGLKEVDPRHIAYVAVLARFILNSQLQWNTRDVAFDNAHFHKHILTAFEVDEWAKETLQWWNAEVYGCSRGQATALEHTDPRPGSLAAQVAARVAQQAAQNAAAD